VGNYIPIPCGGLHVRNTKEIGELILKEKTTEVGKQKLIMRVINWHT
jgi:Ser-tRNA(Ala) deacylase AlaX